MSDHPAEPLQVVTVSAADEVAGAPLAVCPRCGGPVRYDLTCHTWPREGPDGKVRFMACMPCDSAVEYMCAGQFDDEPGECEWRYTHGLNRRNPRSAANEAARPEWVPLEPPRVPFPPWIAPGVQMLGAD